MDDTRDMSWLGHTPAPEAPAVERVLWTLVKTARSARAVKRAHPLGQELRVSVGSELLWSRVFRPAELDALAHEAHATHEAFTARGWSPAA